MTDWKEVNNNTGLWLPTEKGAVAEGAVIEVKQGLYGIQLTIEAADGSVISTPSHKALQTRLTAFKPGDLIKIEYLGCDLPKVKGQNGTRLYGVFRKPAPEAEEVV